MSEQTITVTLGDALLALHEFRRLKLRAEAREIRASIHELAVQTDEKTGRLLKHPPKTPVTFKAERIVIDLIRILADDSSYTEAEFFVKDRKLPVFSGLYVKNGDVSFDYFGQACYPELAVYGTRLTDWLGGANKELKNFREGPGSAALCIADDAARLKIPSRKKAFGFDKFKGGRVPLRLYFRTDSGLGFRALGERSCSYREGAYEVELSAEDLMEYMAAGCEESVLAAGCVFMRFPDPVEDVTASRGKVFLNGARDYADFVVSTHDPQEPLSSLRPMISLPIDLCPALFSHFASFTFPNEEGFVRLIFNYER